MPSLSVPGVEVLVLSEFKYHYITIITTQVSTCIGFSILLFGMGCRIALLMQVPWKVDRVIVNEVE
jgi:hypothetical protein